MANSEVNLYKHADEAAQTLSQVCCLQRQTRGRAGPQHSNSKVVVRDEFGRLWRVSLLADKGTPNSR